MGRDWMTAGKNFAKGVTNVPRAIKPFFPFTAFLFPYF